MAGTCPGCGTKIANNLRQCPSCGSYCLLTQDKCPECEAPLQLSQEEVEATPQSDMAKPTPQRKKKKISLWGFIIGTVFLIIVCAGAYYFYMQRMQKKEQIDYDRLEDVTNPEFYQQFLIDYPKSKHYAEIEERMRVLQPRIHLQDARAYENPLSRKDSRGTE